MKSTENKILIACFFVSGLAGLVYETVWVRELTLLFGTTTFAVSAVIAAFMGGLALGSFVIGKFADRSPSVLLLYSALELGVLLYAFVFPYALEWAKDVYLLSTQLFPHSFYLSSLVKFCIAVVLLSVPTALMGGTFPVLSKCLSDSENRIGTETGRLYSINTFGGAIGVALTGFVLLPNIGVRATTVVAAALNGAAALGAVGVYLVKKRRPQLSRTAEATMSQWDPRATQPSSPSSRSPLEWAVLSTFAISGFVAMIYEVAWTRTLTLVIGSSTYAFNTAGTVIGAFAAGFIFIPMFGIQTSITIGVTAQIALGFAVTSFTPHLEWRNRLATAAFGIAPIVVLLSAPPAWNEGLLVSGVFKNAPGLLRIYGSPSEALNVARSYDLLFYREGPSASVAVLEYPTVAPTRHLALAIDGKVDASTGADLETEVLSGHLPLLFRPHAAEVLVVGYASGITVGSVLTHPVKDITAVEIEPAVVEASRHFDEFNGMPLSDPRVRLVIDDARNFLLVTERKFDVIISEPSNPWMSGPAKLFTREFFDLAKTRLRRGGIFCQWLQAYGMSSEDLRILLRTVQTVFPHLAVFQTSPGDLLVIGSEGPLSFDVARAETRLRERLIEQDLRRVNVRDVFDLLVRIRLAGDSVRHFAGTGGVLNTDDNALIEFSAPKSLYSETDVANLEEMRRYTPNMPELCSNVAGERGTAFYLKLSARLMENDQELLAEEVLRFIRGPESEKSPFVAEAYALLGDIEARRGNTITAENLWHSARQSSPHHVLANLRVAQLHHSRGEFNQAERYFRRVEDTVREGGACRSREESFRSRAL